MKIKTHVLLLAAALISMATLASAERGQSAGRGMRPGGRNYDPATEVTLAGTVDEVTPVPAPANGPGGLHLMVTFKTGPLEVDLGPAAFITARNFAFAKGDPITVIGSRAQRAGHDVIIAREITKGDRVLTLRDAKGIPLWSRRSRK